MPKAKRSPIEYTPQFGAGIFRPKETVDQELAHLEGGEDDGIVAAGAALTTAEPEEATSDAPPRRQAKRGRTNDATNDATNERTNERLRVRHSFDVWQDQLLRLSEIQAERFSRTGRKPKMGELVQEALDAFIGTEGKRTNGRTNERSNER
jgi:hypothetical protein